MTTNHTAVYVEKHAPAIDAAEQSHGEAAMAMLEAHLTWAAYVVKHKVDVKATGEQLAADHGYKEAQVKSFRNRTSEAVGIVKLFGTVAKSMQAIRKHNLALVLQGDQAIYSLRSLQAAFKASAEGDEKAAPSIVDKAKKLVGKVESIDELDELLKAVKAEAAIQRRKLQEATASVDSDAETVDADQEALVLA